MSEKERFAAILDAFHSLGAALEAGVNPLAVGLDPAELVEEMGLVLAEHFESAEVCLKAVATQRCDLLPAVVDMRSDHTVLSRMLTDLRVVVADQARWVELPVRIGDLLERLSTHRESEAALIASSGQPVNLA